MRFFLRVISIFCFWIVFLTGESAEIDVPLHLERELLVTWVDSLEGSETELSSSYLKKLHHILCFDLSHNGMMRLLEERESQLVASLCGVCSKPVDVQALQSRGVVYAIRWKMQHMMVTVQVIDVTGGSFRTIQNIYCTGQFSHDRKVMHQLADCIHELLFERPGVAQAKIIYSLRRGERSEIIESDYDAANMRPMTNVHSLCVTPLWVPSSNNVFDKSSQPKSFIYTSYQLGIPKLYGSPRFRGNSYRVCSMRGNQLTPAFSQDGSLLAFCSDITGTSDLYIVSFREGEGAISKPRQIFRMRGTATGCPTFSPDGKKIAFVSNKDGSPRIYIMDIPEIGTKSSDLHPKLISKKCRVNTAPSWSPDGKKIVYSAKNSGERQVWWYEIETDTEHQLTEGPGSKESPHWAANSFHILFHDYRGSHANLCLINLHQRDPVQLTNAKQGEYYLFPQWEW